MQKCETPPFPAGFSRLGEDQGKFAFSDAWTSGSGRFVVHPADRLVRVSDHPAGRLALDSASAGRASDRPVDRLDWDYLADYPFELTPWIFVPI